MKKVYLAFATFVLTVASVVGAAPLASAGGSGDFYYQRYSSYVCGIRISVSNYDNSTGGQTYHFGFQGSTSGWTPVRWVIGGKSYYSYGWGGYINFSNKSTDHTFTGYIKNKSGQCYMTIPYTAWR